jgi:hypothetical protein
MSYSPTVPGRMNAIKPLRGFAFTAPTAAPANVDKAVGRPADVGQRGDEGWHVLADPEGNEFCLLRPLAT